MGAIEPEEGRAGEGKGSGAPAAPAGGGPRGAGAEEGLLARRAGASRRLLGGEGGSGGPGQRPTPAAEGERSPLLAGRSVTPAPSRCALNPRAAPGPRPPPSAATAAAAAAAAATTCPRHVGRKRRQSRGRTAAEREEAAAVGAEGGRVEGNALLLPALWTRYRWSGAGGGGGEGGRDGWRWPLPPGSWLRRRGGASLPGHRRREGRKALREVPPAPAGRRSDVGEGPSPPRFRCGEAPSRPSGRSGRAQRAARGGRAGLPRPPSRGAAVVPWALGMSRLRLCFAWVLSCCPSISPLLF